DPRLAAARARLRLPGAGGHAQGVRHAGSAGRRADAEEPALGGRLRVHRPDAEEGEGAVLRRHGPVPAFEPTVFTLHLLRSQPRTLASGPRRADRRRPVAQAIPAAAVLPGLLRRLLVEPRVGIVRVRLDDAVLHPAGEGGDVDPEAAGELLLG